MLTEALTNINLFGACSQSTSSHNNYNDIVTTSTARAAALVGGVLLNPFRNIFSISTSTVGGLNGAARPLDCKTTTSIPNGTQDIVWESSTSLCGQLSSCFVLHEILTDVQIKVLYSLGPNQYNLNWLELNELNDLRSKFMFYYDAKCCKEDNCYDLSMRNANGKFTGKRYRLKCLKVSCDGLIEGNML